MIKTLLGGALILAFVLSTGTAVADPKDHKRDNPGKPFSEIGEQLDRIEGLLLGHIHVPDGTRVVTTSEVLRLAAPILACEHPLGCTCFLNGIKTACSFVFACLDAEACTCVSGCDNVP